MVASDTPIEVSLADAATLRNLSERESELLRKAGERVFELSRKVADRDREVDRVRSELAHVRELLEETRRTRDVLSAQVQSLQRDAEKNYEERAELRRLLASLQMQLQGMLSSIFGQEAGKGAATLDRKPIGRVAPQRDAAQRRPGRERPRRRRQGASWLPRVVKDLW